MRVAAFAFMAAPRLKEKDEKSGKGRAQAGHVEWASSGERSLAEARPRAGWAIRCEDGPRWATPASRRTRPSRRGCASWAGTRASPPPRRPPRGCLHDAADLRRPRRSCASTSTCGGSRSRRRCRGGRARSTPSAARRAAGPRPGRDGAPRVAPPPDVRPAPPLRGGRALHAARRRRLYEEGVACVTLDVRRENPHSKDTRFIADGPGRLREAAGRGRGGAARGRGRGVLEGLSSNFFAVVGGALRTEEERVLIGVTRSLVLEVAEAVAARRAARGAPRRAATPSTRPSSPASRARSCRSSGSTADRSATARVGPATRAIMDGFAALVRRETDRL